MTERTRFDGLEEATDPGDSDRGSLRVMSFSRVDMPPQKVLGHLDLSPVSFESILEQDLAELLAFDVNVDRVENNPTPIHYVGKNGRIECFTPRVFVRYRRDIRPARHMRHLLCEVQMREDYLGRGLELKHRLRAARIHAHERGWQFRVLTEREIRTPYLDNARLLRPFRDIHVRSEDESSVLEQLQSLGESSPIRLLESLGTDEPIRNHYSRIVWKLIADFQIAADLTRPVTMGSRIWYRG